MTLNNPTPEKTPTRNLGKTEIKGKPNLKEFDY